MKDEKWEDDKKKRKPRLCIAAKKSACSCSASSRADKNRLVIVSGAQLEDTQEEMVAGQKRCSTPESGKEAFDHIPARSG
jgi:hypothetical protein